MITKEFSEEISELKGKVLNYELELKAYEKEFGTTPSMFAGMAYDTVTVMMKAINKAKSTDPEKVNAALAKVKVSDDEAVCGGFTYDKNHNPVKELNIVTIKNGQYVTTK